MATYPMTHSDPKYQLRDDNNSGPQTKVLVAPKSGEQFGVPQVGSTVAANAVGADTAVKYTIVGNVATPVTNASPNGHAWPGTVNAPA